MKRKLPDQPPVVLVRLYLDDVHALYDELVSAFGAAKLETPEFEFDDPDDLANLGREPLSHLMLHGSEGVSSSVHVHVGKTRASVTRFGDTAESIAAAEKLGQILLGCRMRLHWLFSFWMFLFVFPLEVAGFLVASQGGTGALIAGLLLAGAAGLGFAAILVMRTRQGAVVYLRRRRDSPSFFKRNSDALIVNGVIALVAAVAGAVAVRC